MKKHNKKIKITFFCILFVLSMGQTLHSAETKKSFRLSVGSGVAIKNNIRKNNLHSGDGGDVLINPLPFVQFAWGPVFIGQQGLTISLLGDRDKSFYININNGGDRYDGEGMQSRRTSFFAGGGLKYHKYSFHLARDINGRSHGFKSSLSYAEMYTINKTFFTRSSMTLDCFDHRYSEYYYGVRNFEASAILPEYHPGAYCSLGMSFFPGYKFSDDLSAVTGLSLKNVPNVVRHSPTTNDNWLEMALILGGLWQF